MTTVAGTTPYAWPYDAGFDPARTALVVVLGDDAPGVPAAVAVCLTGVPEVGAAPTVKRDGDAYTVTWADGIQWSGSIQ